MFCNGGGDAFEFTTNPVDIVPIANTAVPEVEKTCELLNTLKCCCKTLTASALVTEVKRFR